MSGQSGAAKVRREGRCRTCGAAGGLTRHHLVAESWFRRHPGVPHRHHPDNIVPLCVYCHRVVDGFIGIGPASDRQREKRRVLRSAMLEAEVEFVVRVRGRQWLDHHYPLATLTHDARAFVRLA